MTSSNADNVDEDFFDTRPPLLLVISSQPPKQKENTGEKADSCRVPEMDFSQSPIPISKCVGPPLQELTLAHFVSGKLQCLNPVSIKGAIAIPCPAGKSLDRHFIGNSSARLGKWSVL